MTDKTPPTRNTSAASASDANVVSVCVVTGPGSVVVLVVVVVVVCVRMLWLGKYPKLYTTSATLEVSGGNGSGACDAHTT